jgi:hypothetical protein
VPTPASRTSKDHVLSSFLLECVPMNVRTCPVPRFALARARKRPPRGGEMRSITAFKMLLLTLSVGAVNRVATDSEADTDHDPGDVLVHGAHCFEAQEPLWLTNARWSPVRAFQVRCRLLSARMRAPPVRLSSSVVLYVASWIDHTVGSAQYAARVP